MSTQAFDGGDPTERSRLTEDPAAHDIVAALRHIVRVVRAQSRSLARNHGISVPDLLALQAIADHADGTTASAIRARVQVSAGTLSQIVQRLVTLGHVARVRDPDDRRRVLLFPTDAGNALLGELPESFHDRFLDRLRTLPADDRRDLLATLLRLAELLDAREVTAAPILSGEDDLSEP